MCKSRSQDGALKRSRQGFLKRQKELARQAKRKAKEEKKAGRRDGLEIEPVEGDDGLGEPEGLDFHAADGVLADSVDAVIPGETTVEAEEPAENEDQKPG